MAHVGCWDRLGCDQGRCLLDRFPDHSNRLVCPHVLLEGHGLGVALAADLTGEGPLSGVQPPVDNQGGGLRETLATVLTLVRFFT